jgi:hypothetical protein
MSTGLEDQDRPWAAKVEALAGYGLAAADIACVLAMDEDCLKPPMPTSWKAAL